jgi:ATP-GRASP peptide maturase of grasp-with-spasm system
MVLIISNGYDQSVNLVIDWLLYFEKEYLVITPDSEVIILNIVPNVDLILQVDGVVVHYSSISAFWFRRGSINLTIQKPAIENLELQKYVEIYLISEAKTLLDYLWMKFHSMTYSLGNYYQRAVNKLEVLEKAENIGLLIPKTLISGRKKDLLHFHHQHQGIVNKSIQDIFQGVVANTFLYNYTEVISANILNTIEESFFPSLVQNNIEKLFEIRAIFIAGLFTTFAIFSQNQQETKTDFRRSSNQTRKSVFDLPFEIKNKLSKLMASLNLNFGCIDLIYTPDKEFVFLEVNPVGQSSKSSKSLNLGIEKQIAQYLIKNETH